METRTKIIRVCAVIATRDLASTNRHADEGAGADVANKNNEDRKMKRFNPCLPIVLAATVLFGLAAPGVYAQEKVETNVDVNEEFAKDKTGTNPLNFSNDARIYNEYRWLNTDGDGDQNVVTAEFRTPFAGGKWQFRAKIRRNDLKADFNDDGFDDVDEGGFGDTDIRFGTVPHIDKKMGVFTGVEFFLNTATEDALGTGANSVAPFLFLAYWNPIGPGSIFAPGYQHTYSVDEDSGRDKIRQGLIDMFLVKTWKDNKYWGYVDPQIILDYETNEEFMLLELQAGMMTGPAGQSTWVMPSFGVGTDRPYDFSLELGYKVVW